MNARFWIYNNGWVKLTLKPEQELHHYFSCLTDEGYFTKCEKFSYHDKFVYIDYYEDGRDCDGPYSRCNLVKCHLVDLKALAGEDILGEVAPDRPKWTKISASQRDYFAEEMGY